MVRRKFKFGHIVNDIPLNYKFMLIYVIGILLPIVIINYMFMDKISGFIKDREEQNLQISLERARKDIAGMIDGGVAVSHSLVTDKLLYETLDRTYNGSADFYETFDDQLRHRVNSYIPVNNQIQRINVYTDNPSIVQGSNYFILNNTIQRSAWYQGWEKFTGSVQVAAYREPVSDDPKATSPAISVIEKMDYYFADNSFKKLVRIDFDLNRFYEIIVRERDYLKLYLVNGSNEIIVSTDSSYGREYTQNYNLFDLNAGGNANELHTVPISNASYVKGWRLIGVPQGTRVNQAMLDMWLTFGMLAGLITLFTSGFIYIMLRSYNYRVKRLSRHMYKVTNEKFDLIKMDEGRDEIGHLIRNFNNMTSQIDSLIHNVYKLEIQQKSLETERIRAELNLLQSQMNPHFLFNTLNALLVVSTKNNYTDVKDIIKDLSKLLRRLLNWKDDLVSLEEEVNFTVKYLGIEKFRFLDKFQYTLDIAEEALPYKIPKMSIQQLAENACKHGIQAIEGLGLVHISARIVDDHLQVVVSDNGKGMDEEHLKELLRHMRSDDEAEGGSTGIGIRNIYRRLELYYNDSVIFNIISKSDQGTSVSYVIPCRLLERHERGETKNGAF